MQLGFIIDHSRCIGCHACTVACKSENDVPLGDFRTWVKYTEEGTFPEVRRSFAVLRCNQCSEPPCVDICPTNALEKLANGVVDINHDSCIGCKSCMQACPYDALYINEDEGTAEKCHFCNHRAEIGLAPACAVVCPTEAIIPGDFDDPLSLVSRMRREEDLKGRKVEAGTVPNVLYKEANPNTITPTQANGTSGYIWSNNPDGVRKDAEAFQAEQDVIENKARTVYDVPRKPLWDWKVGAYFTTKSLAAGFFIAALPLFLKMIGGESSLAVGVCIGAAILFLMATGVLLLADLKKPMRFIYILLRPNWKSWLCWGSVAILLFGVLMSLWGGLWALSYFGERSVGEITGSVVAYVLLLVTTGSAAFVACYTAWLFHQCHGRPLWMKKLLGLSLALHAFLAGCAGVLIIDQVMVLIEVSAWGPDEGSLSFVRLGFVGALIAHLLMMLGEKYLAPKNREVEYHRAAKLITHGPFASRHWGVSIFMGVFLPLTFMLFSLVLSSAVVPPLMIVAGFFALVGLLNEEDLFVKAGQALPIS
jgi:Fe-S-cluster-containing dehydrogenase component/VIT1/CCC1 family predicted Fe2+/Mn2+ transporter